MLEENQCLQHGEQKVFVARDQASQKLIKLCEKCVTPVKASVVHLDDVLADIKSKKQSIIQYFQERKNQDVSILYKIINSLQNQKNEYVKKIGEAVKIIEQEIQKLEQITNEVQQQIVEIQTIDLDQLLDNFVNLNNNGQIQGALNIYKCLVQIKSHSLNSESFTILFKYPSTKIINMPRGLYEEKLKITCVCREHQENVVGLDLSKIQSMGDYLLCIACAASRNSTFTTESKAREIWNQHQAYIFQYCSNLQEKQEKITQQMIEQFQEQFNLFKQKVEEFCLFPKAEEEYKNGLYQKFSLQEQTIKQNQKLILTLTQQQDIEYLVQLEKNQIFSKLNQEIIQRQLDHLDFQVRSSKTQIADHLKQINIFLSLLQNSQFTLMKVQYLVKKILEIIWYSCIASSLNFKFCRDYDRSYSLGQELSMRQNFRCDVHNVISHIKQIAIFNSIIIYTIPQLLENN